MKICNCSLAGTGACKTCSNYPFSYHIVNDLIDSRKTISEHSAWFRISETLVDESKGHITPEQAIRKIREYLRMMEKPERKKGEWIPFKQEQNPETGRWEFVDPPEDGQHIFITVNLPGHEPVQDDYWYRDVYGHLDSGYTPCDEAIAWKPMPEPYRGEQG